MIPHQLSSGDLIADRRAEYALMLAASGDQDGAADLMRQALELAPGWAAGWFRLADYEEKSGRKEAAAAALDKVLALSPDDLFGAGLKRAVLLGEAPPAQAPSAYVARLFDDYADRFDAALVERLDYTVPQALAALVLPLVDARPIPLAVDLGCGTGLFGAEIRNAVSRLEGFDLSAGMLAKAAEKGLYDHLGQADLSLAATASGLFEEGYPEERADLVAAADVLMYLGDLEAPFALLPRLVKPGGLLAFSVEDAGADGDVVLRPSLRYAHSEAHLRRLCTRSEFDIVQIERRTIRKDGGMPIAGILFVARRRL
ncbi:methyltransferase domain-containing protein [Rhizobium sp. YIM 134829]|uniref:methyltransferase domain-containing protein n=1 Tax=Rhizobium sp. YIM 134829 TaxID=3390453 RepID=UPI0039797F50